MTKFKSLILLEPRKLHHQNQASMNKLSLEKSKDSPKPKYFFMPINQWHQTMGSSKYCWTIASQLSPNQPNFSIGAASSHGSIVISCLEFK